MEIKKIKEKPIVRFFAPIIFLAFAVGVVKAAESGKIGFFWIGNNTYDSGEKSDATIGMIKMGGDAFGLKIDKENANSQLVKGEAWMGIGSSDDNVRNFNDQKDHPSLGWIRFDRGYPNFCGADKSCRPATWQRKSGVGSDSLEGYLTGWAKFELGKNGDGSDYPETWVYFKSPVNPAEFSCDARSSLNRTKDYYACTDKNGYLFGYGWSSEASATTIADNSGFGWINMPGVSFNNCEANGICNLNCPYDPDCCRDKEYFGSHDQCKECDADNKCNLSCSYDHDCCDDKNYAAGHQGCVVSQGFCSLYRTSPGGSGKIKAGTNVKYHISINGGSNPEKILYKCTEGGSERELPGAREANYECGDYSSENSKYVSSVKYLYKQSDGETKAVDCNNSITIMTEGVGSAQSEQCSCEVNVKKANTTGQEGNKWARTLRLDNGSEEVEASVNTSGDDCSGEKPVFEVNDAAGIVYGDNSVKFTLNDKVAQIMVSASIKDKSGKEITCGPADVSVKARMGWR